MQRRAFLEWTIRGLGAVFAAVIGVPAAAFLLDGRNRPGRQSGYRTVARLRELQVGVPREVLISETRRDAWNTHPEAVVGRVWLIRRDNDQVDAFSAVCPHLGCSINRSDGGFLCPCHGGHFDLDGKRIIPARGSNPAPRDMDRLPVERVEMADQRDFEIKVEYKRFKTGLAHSEAES